jgi:hypothetical protein
MHVGRGESARDRGVWIYEGIRKRMRRGVLVRPTPSPETRDPPRESMCLGEGGAFASLFALFFMVLLDSFGFVLFSLCVCACLVFCVGH